MGISRLQPRTASQMIEPRDGFVSVNGLRFHYLEWGDTRHSPILLLHGGSAHAHWWDFFAHPLQNRYRLMALDLRGHGDSEWAAPKDYRLKMHAADVRGITEALGLRDLILIGHSFGGFVAMEYASRMSQRLAALVLIDSPPHISQRDARFLNALHKLPQPIYASPDEAARRFRLLPARSTAPPEMIAHVARHAIRQCDGGRWTLKFDRRSIANIQPVDLSHALAAIRCPILVVRGAHSRILPAAALAEFTRATPHAHLIEIADADHHIMLDQPAALTQAVDAFLATHVGRAQAPSTQ